MRVNKLEKIQEYIDNFNILNFFSIDIKNKLEVHSYQREEFITREMEELNRLYFIVEGKVKLYQTHRNGKISLISFYNAGSILGEIELLGVMKTAHSVQVVEDTICIELPLYHIREDVLNDRVFLLQISKYLAYKAIHNMDHMMKSQAYPLEARLANFILTSSPENYYEEKHTEASQYLGVSYRHLLRILSEFQKKGYMKKEGTYYLIQNREALKKMASEMDEIC